MASVEPRAGQLVIVADCDDERALYLDGERRGGRIVLEEAYYPVRDNTLFLPENISRSTAERLAVGVHLAAISFRRAQRRRDSFRVA